MCGVFLVCVCMHNSVCPAGKDGSGLQNFSPVTVYPLFVFLAFLQMFDLLDIDLECQAFSSPFVVTNKSQISSVQKNVLTLFSLSFLLLCGY